jgi:Tol biopolymer transport system component
MKTLSLRAALLVAAASAVSAACDNPTNGTPRDEPGLRVVAGANVSDTVMTVPTQALAVEVIGENGEPASGVPVRFEAVMTNTPRGPVPPVYLSGVGDTQFTIIAVDTTDAAGRAHARVAFGTIAGPGSVTVIAPTMGLQTTASYTIKPGSPARVTTAPQDTMLATGRSLSVSAMVVDRYGNARDGGVALRVASGPVSLAGSTVTASGFGRAMVVAQEGSFADTTMVSVVPQGTIAAYTAMQHTGHELAIYRFDLDGSNFSKVTSSVMANGYWGEMPSEWSADGTKLFFHDNNPNHTKQLYVYDFGTSTRRRLIEPGLQLESESWPRVSHDGQWVYFTGGGYGEATIHRVRADGTGRERVRSGRDASLSPDGTRLAYISGTGLTITTLSTGQSVTVPGAAASPRWTPQGNEVAYISVTETFFSNGELRAVKPDGTGNRALTANGTLYRAHFDFSPDGKYIIAATANAVLTVIDVATGAELPISLRRVDHGFLAPTWKP